MKRVIYKLIACLTVVAMIGPASILIARQHNEIEIIQVSHTSIMWEPTSTTITQIHGWLPTVIANT